LAEFVDYPLETVRATATPDAMAYIEQYQLAAGVAEIAARLPDFMPTMVEIALDLYEDPDCDCEPEVTLYALFPDGTTEDAMDEAMSRFDEGWWLDNSGRWDYRIEVHTGWVE
jgi:hypothetical protein